MLSVKHSATYPPSASSVTSRINSLSLRLSILLLNTQDVTRTLSVGNWFKLSAATWPLSLRLLARGNLPVELLHDRMRLGTDGNCPGQIRIAKGLQCSEQEVPPAFPHLHQFRARCWRRFKFAVAVAVGLFSIAG